MLEISFLIIFSYIITILIIFIFHYDFKFMKTNGTKYKEEKLYFPPRKILNKNLKFKTRITKLKQPKC